MKVVGANGVEGEKVDCEAAAGDVVEVEAGNEAEVGIVYVREADFGCEAAAGPVDGYVAEGSVDERVPHANVNGDVSVGVEVVGGNVVSKSSILHWYGGANEGRNWNGGGWSKPESLGLLELVEGDS